MSILIHFAPLPRRCARALSSAAALVLVLAPAAAQAPVKYKVVILPVPPGSDSAFPTAMNAKGVIAGNAGSDPFDPLSTPVYNTGRRFTIALEKPTDSLNFALGIGDTNLIVGSSSSFPYAWQSGVPTPLSPAAGLVQGSAHGANTSGVICGALYNDFSGQQLPVYWPGAAAPGLGLPLGAGSGGAAFAINTTGQIAGAVYGGGFAFQGARWDDPALAPALIGVLPGAMNSELRAINALGDTAGRSSFPDFSTQAILHVKATGTLTGLGVLGGNYSEAFGIDSAKGVVGTSSTAGGAPHAFLWRQGTLHDLNDLIQSATGPLSFLASAVAIDDAGRIAAEAVIPTPIGSASRMALLLPVGP